MDFKQSILAIAKAMGGFAISRWLTANQLRILAYHGIWLGREHFGNFLYMRGDTFKRRMALLHSWGYPVVSLNDAFKQLTAGTLPRHATVITIDDGWYGTYRDMLPVLREHEYPATLYLTTYYCLKQAPVVDVALQYCFHNISPTQYPEVHLPEYGLGPFPVLTEAERMKALRAALDVIAALESDEQRQVMLRALCHKCGVDYEKVCDQRWFNLMTEAEVKDTANHGIDVELHTHHHRITDEYGDCLQQELTVNRDYIQTITGQSPHHFCYPSGRFSPTVWPTLAQNDIRTATTTEVGLVDASTPRYALPRILDGQSVSELEFEAEMSGFMELVRKARGALRPNRHAERDD